METIFYFEDEKEWREKFGTFLRRQSYQVDEFTNYKGAMDAAADPQRDCPNIAIIDLRDKDMDYDQAGIDIIRRLRGRWPKLPILVLSVFDDVFFKKESYRALANGYITKGEANDKEYLLAQVRTYIELGRMATGQTGEEEDESTAILGSLTYYLDEDRFEWKGKPIKLSTTQRLIVATLVISPTHYKPHDALLKVAKIPKTSIEKAQERLEMETDRLLDMLESGNLSPDKEESIRKKYHRYHDWLENDPGEYANKLDMDLIRRHIADIRKAFKQIDSNFNCLESDYGSGYRWVPDKKINNSNTAALRYDSR